MKYLVFSLALAVGVPVMILAVVLYDRFRDWLLGALVFSTVLGDMANINFLSLETYRGPDRGFEINLTDLIVVALIAALALRHWSRIRWVPYNTLPIVGVCMVALIATFAAQQPLLGAFTLFKMLRFYALYWCVTNSLRTGASLESIRWGFIGIGVFLTALTVHQKYVLHIYRVFGSFDHSNTIPSYVVQILPLLVAWTMVVRGGRTKTLLSIAAIVGLLFTVVATFSRAGIAVALCSSLIALGMTLHRASWSRLAGAAAVLFLTVLAGTKATDSLVQRFTDAPTSSRDARREFNIAAKLMAKDKLFGVGLNNFAYALTTSERYRQHISVMAHEEQAGVAHNIYRLTAAEIGYPGLLLFILVLLRFAWLAARRGVRLAHQHQIVLASIFLAYGSIHAIGFLEWTFRTTPVLYLFGIVSGLCVALAERDTDGASETSPRLQQRILSLTPAGA